MLAALTGAAGAYADDTLNSSATALNQSDPLAPADDSTLSAPKSNLIPDQAPDPAADKAPAADAKPAETPAKSLTPNADAEAAKAAAQARARAQQAAEARAAAAADGGDREDIMEQRMEAQQERMEAVQERAEMIGEMISGD
jgi:hypothetical protein